ncbi:MAG: zinc-ribbon domain-containing protein [Chloroflexi bacterium]|nr:zinc-ribbon domain-containing protein [Chloroflexota bacterium]
MSTKSFPTITCLSAKSLTTTTLKMSMTGSSRKPSQIRSKNNQPREGLAVQKKASEPNVPQPKFVCPYCNGDNPENATSCIHCGQALKEKVVYYCSNCGKDVDEDANVCTHCGVRLDDDDYL